MWYLLLFLQLAFWVNTARAGTCSSSTTPLSESCIYNEVCTGGGTLILEMSDSYGDGWNGNTITITSEGQSVTKTLSSGSYGTASITAGPTASISDLGGGTWQDEVSWVLKGCDGSSISEGNALSCTPCNIVDTKCDPRTCTSDTCPAGNIFFDGVCYPGDVVFTYTQELTGYTLLASNKYCNPWKYLSEGAYPPRLSSSHPLYDSDPIMECAKRCNAQSDAGSPGFFLKYNTNCACTSTSNNHCSGTSANGYTTYKMTFSSVPSAPTLTSCTPGYSGSPCTACLAGKYSSDGTACVDCDTGQYQNQAGQPSCNTCGTNEVPNTAKTGCQCIEGHGGSPCTACQAGQFSTGGADCTLCTDGYQDETGETSCKTCNDPHANPNADKTGCQCKDGHGGSPCLTCEAGHFSTGGADCTLCTDGYQDETGKTSCKPCNNGYVNNEKTTCTLCPLNDYKYDWNSGCPDWSTNDGCFCNCTGSGFSGDHCDICAKGMGWNGVLGADAKCTGCEFPTVNDQTSHNALCSHDFCPPGSGTTSDVNAWHPDNSTAENCVACTGSTVSPSYYGQCTEVLCDDYMTVKDTIDHELNNTNQTNCEPCSGYNVGASCSPIVCETGRMKTPHDGSSDGDRYIDYSLESNNQDNCIPCGVDEVVSADGTSCVRVVCPDGHKILVEDSTLAYNNQTNCVPCEGFTYAEGTECIGFDCGSKRIKEVFVRTEEASKCGEQCTGDTILDVNDLTQCVACEGDTVVNSNHTECVTSVCRDGYFVNITDRSLAPKDGYHQAANCEEVDDCLTASCSPCGDLMDDYVCTEEIELRQGIEAFANANEHICPSGFRLSSEAPVNAADIGLRDGACPPLKVFAEKLSIHEGNFRSKLVEGTASVVVEGKACKYTYEDLISGTYEV